ncbi:MAG: hypothetical protein JSS49_29495 [Planctomycetes bacterium]|nr:hypothetical protein [Planctomycetota bacterium]
MHRLSGGIDYSEVDRACVRKMVIQSPSLRGEFQQRVLHDHDWDYWRSLVKQIRTESSDESEAINASQ